MDEIRQRRKQEYEAAQKRQGTGSSQKPQSVNEFIDNSHFSNNSTASQSGGSSSSRAASNSTTNNPRSQNTRPNHSNFDQGHGANQNNTGLNFNEIILWIKTLVQEHPGVSIAVISAFVLCSWIAKALSPTARDAASRNYSSSGSGGFGSFLIVGGILFGLFQTAPEFETFKPWFKDWFLNVYMPAGGRIYRDRIKEQSKNKGLFSKIAASVKVALHEITEDVNNAMLYELAVKHSLPHADKIDFIFGKLMRVNIGSRRHPITITFLGIANNWFFVPFEIAVVEDRGLLEWEQED